MPRPAGQKFQTLLILRNTDYRVHRFETTMYVYSSFYILTLYVEQKRSLGRAPPDREISSYFVRRIAGLRSDERNQIPSTITVRRENARYILLLAKACAM